MSNTKFKILIVDDHPLIVEGYKTILSYCNLEFDLDIDVAYDCKSAYQFITSFNLYDLIFLDVSLPSWSDENIYSGIDLANVALNINLESKIVFITGMINIFTLYEIKNRINPIGIIIKSDLGVEEFVFAIESIVNNKKYYSENVIKGLQEFLFTNNNLFLDMYNRKILILLSNGFSNKSISTQLKISVSALEYRKNKIKNYFGIINGSDEEIIREAKKRNLI